MKEDIDYMMFAYENPYEEKIEREPCFYSRKDIDIVRPNKDMLKFTFYINIV